MNLFSKIIITFILFTGYTYANPVKDVGIKTANQILNKCDTNWIPGDCLFKAYLAYKIANTAMNIKSFEIKRSARLKRVGRSNIKRLFKLTPQGRVVNNTNKLYRVIK